MAKERFLDIEYEETPENSAVTCRREPFADRVFDFALQNPSSYVCQTAQTFEDSREAYRLVHQEYFERGYCKPKPSRTHYTYYCLLPKSRTFLLSKKGKNQVLGTASLVLDSPYGLPIESLFPERLGQIRAEGKRLAEVTLLAVSAQEFGKKIFSLTNVQKLIATFRLFKGLFTHARFEGVTDLIIAVNPKHEKLYHCLTFESLGPARPYSGACDNLALLMHLDVIRFADVGFQEQRMVQKYFLEESNAHDPVKRPPHWDPVVLERLFLEAPSLPDEMFLKNLGHFSGAALNEVAL